MNEEPSRIVYAINFFIHLLVGFFFLLISVVNMNKEPFTFDALTFNTLTMSTFLLHSLSEYGIFQTLKEFLVDAEADVRALTSLYSSVVCNDIDYISDIITKTFLS